MNTPIQAKISTNPTSSNAARLMPRVTNAPMPATSPIATAAVAHRSAIGTWRWRSMVRARMPRNDSITPDAARSCRNRLALRGISPTRARWTPTDAISATRVVAERLVRGVRMPCRSARTRSANTMINAPVMTIVALKV